jgi:hypothetical protein
VCQASEALVAESVKRWKIEEDVVDDITCVVVFVNVPPPTSSVGGAGAGVGAGKPTAATPAAVVAPSGTDHGATDVDTIQLIPSGKGGAAHSRDPSGEVPTVNPMMVARAPGAVGASAPGPR